MRNSFTPSFEDLPHIIPLFPLNGVVVLPHSQLPLNIFEPRYLNMVSDALSGHRLIGMVQPLDSSEEERPELNRTGCVGRIVSFSETSDGRLMLLLSGISRFDIDEEIELHRNYRRARVSWSRFAHDLYDKEIDFDQERLLGCVAKYLDHRQLTMELESVSALEVPELVDTLASSLPFSPREKQGLLETLAIQDRYGLLIALCEFQRGHVIEPADRAH